MPPSPIVSVVIPSYQQRDFIVAAVESVLAQEEVDYELIIADHSSDDGTWEKLNAYADHPRVRLSRTASGGGAPRNWNEVTRLARGTFIKLLPGDDTILPGTLARQAAILQSDPKRVLTAGKRDVIDARGETIFRARGLGGLTAPTAGGDAIRATVRSGTNLFGEPGAVLLRRDVLVDAGLWDAEFPYAIDEASYIRVLENGDFAPDVETASTFRLSGGQWSVALVRRQAEQMASLHAAVHARRPDLVSSTDVRIGNRRARLLAHQRRIVYRVLKGRMA